MIWRQVVVGDGLLRIEYGLARRLWADPDQDQLDVWDVTLEAGSFTIVGDDENGVVWTAVAQATLFGMDPERQALLGQLPLDVADAHSGDAAYYYEHVFDAGGQLLTDAADQFEWQHGRALFLYDVHVAGEYRRQGFASLPVADAILTLAPHGTAVFAHPGPTDLNAYDDDDVQHLRHQTTTSASWQAWGSSRSEVSCGPWTSRPATVPRHSQSSVALFDPD